MADVSSHEMAAKLLTDGFTRAGPLVDTLSDPLADTYMVVTLDELRPYELNPRITRNPRYEEIKASIRERGLDASPPITRRPGAPHYTIRNGGNTRLAILRELWAETKEERFFRIGCLFRPWSERGEIIALTGHLAEDELHGRLTFIERALGVQRASELYELESGKPPSQSELARRLKVDGYPVPQPHISRMQEAIQYLLPAIPSVLYAGLGRHQVEQLTSLRRAAEKAYTPHGTQTRQTMDFLTLFHEVLALFDEAAGSFSTQRVQDELIGQMAEHLCVPYDTLAFQINDANRRWQALENVDASPPPSTVPAPASQTASYPDNEEDGVRSPASTAITSSAPHPPPATSCRPTSTAPALPQSDDENESANTSIRQPPVVSPADTTDRLQSLQRLVADHTGEALPDFGHNVLQSVPIQASGLYPITDIWRIEPAMDDSDRLRTHIYQYAREIAAEVNLHDRIQACEFGLGYTCQPGEGAGTHRPADGTLLDLLQSLSAPYLPDDETFPAISASALDNTLGVLLLGNMEVNDRGEQPSRLSDEALVKLFRLLRLSRRLVDLATNNSKSGGA